MINEEKGGTQENDSSRWKTRELPPDSPWQEENLPSSKYGIQAFRWARKLARNDVSGNNVTWPRYETQIGQLMQQKKR